LFDIRNNYVRRLNWLFKIFYNIDCVPIFTVNTEDLQYILRALYITDFQYWQWISERKYCHQRLNDVYILMVQQNYFYHLYLI